MKKGDRGRYHLCWYEYHNPNNWGETEEEGIKELKDSFPVHTWQYDPNESDGWVELDCRLYYNRIDQAIRMAEEHCCGNGVDVFSIIDSNTGKTVFTEEDWDDYEKATLPKRGSKRK